MCPTALSSKYTNMVFTWSFHLTVETTLAADDVHITRPQLLSSISIKTGPRPQMGRSHWSRGQHVLVFCQQSQLTLRYVGSSSHL